jgi:threonyl-tRNA synthetase
MSNNEELNNLRHSAAHLLAAAVIDIWPGSLQTIGPAIENGFYEDLDVGEVKISESDFARIENKMRELVKSWKSFERIEMSEEEAREFYKNNPYKLELLDEIVKRDEPITLYKAGNYPDLCRGGHEMNPSEELKHFKLMKVAGAYWRGDEKNKMLTRIYGTAFPTKEELEQHLVMLEEAEKRDHKKLGKELDLFVFSETVGKGLPLFTPKGSVIRRELERFIVDEEIKRGYVHVYTPDIARLELYKKSGHYPYYKDSMYAPIQIEDDEFMLRPMTCPHHFELYLSKQHSYRELPLRIAELAKLYRYEKSGELMGLQRVRTFCLADSHIVTAKSQAEQEINGVLDLIEYIAKVFDLKQGQDYHYRLSLGDRNDDKKYFKDDASWDFAEDTLRKVLQTRNAHFVEAEAEAAFYGPKIDIQMKNVNGKEDTAFTVQYDFVMPKRFELSFINEAGVEEQPVVIHRSSIGAIERVLAFLIEHYAGNFPLWLSPIQVKIIPIADRHIDFAKELAEKLKEQLVRVEIDDRAENMRKKIRDAQVEKANFMIVIGDKEVESKSLSVRKRSGENMENVNVDEFIGELLKQIKNKEN